MPPAPDRMSAAQAMWTFLRHDVVTRGFFLALLFVELPFFLPFLSRDEVASYSVHCVELLLLCAVIVALRSGFDEIRDPTEKRFWSYLGFALATRRSRQDGSQVEARFLGIPLTVDRELIGIFCIYQDITVQKWAERALRESEERVRRLEEELRQHSSDQTPGPSAAS